MDDPIGDLADVTLGDQNVGHPRAPLEVHECRHPRLPQVGVDHQRAFANLGEGNRQVR